MRQPSIGTEMIANGLLVQVRETISNLHKAATAARAFARPRGDVERSETVASENIHTKCVVQVRGTTSNLTTHIGLAGGNLQANNPKSEILVPPAGIEPALP